MELFTACSQKKFEELKRVKNAFKLKGKITTANYIKKADENDESETVHVTTMVEGSGFERHIYKSHNTNDLEEIIRIMADMKRVEECVNEEGKIFVYVHPVKEMTTNSPFLYHDEESGMFWSVFNDVDSLIKNHNIEFTEEMEHLIKVIVNFSNFFAELDAKKVEEVVKNLNLR